MQYGINIPQLFSSDRFDADMLRRYLTMVEDKGFHSAWVMERVVGTPPALDPLVLLSYAAANSSKITLGSNIIISVLRNPVILAKSLSSIDHLSDGRLIVGLAFGGFTQEPYYPAFGVAAKTAGSRFEEGVHIVKKLWTEERTTFQGRFWQLNDMEVTPKPLQKPHPPLWFGAHSQSAIKRAVRMGTAGPVRPSCPQAASPRSWSCSKGNWRPRVVTLPSSRYPSGCTWPSTTTRTGRGVT